MVLAGRSQYKVGTRVRLKGITDPFDKDLNGREGILVQPFKKFPIQDVGVLLDTGDPHDPRPVTVYLNEFEVVSRQE